MEQQIMPSLPDSACSSGNGNSTNVMGCVQQPLLIHSAMMSRKPAYVFYMADLQDARVHPAEIEQPCK